MNNKKARNAYAINIQQNKISKTNRNATNMPTRGGNRNHANAPVRSRTANNKQEQISIGLRRIKLSQMDSEKPNE